MRGNPVILHVVGGHPGPATFGGCGNALGVGGQRCEDDRRVGLLQRLFHDPLTDFREQRAFGGCLVVLALQVVRRFPGPDREHLIDGFHHLLVLVEVEIAKHLDIRGQPPGSDPHQHPAVEQVVHHRHLRGDMDGMIARHVDHAGAQLDLAGFLDERGEKDHAAGDRLGQIGHVLTHECLTIAKFVGKDHRVLILLEDFAIIPCDRVDGLGEETELHDKYSK